MTHTFKILSFDEWLEYNEHEIHSICEKCKYAEKCEWIQDEPILSDDFKLYPDGKPWVQCKGRLFQKMKKLFETHRKLTVDKWFDHYKSLNKSIVVHANEIEVMG